MSEILDPLLRAGEAELELDMVLNLLHLTLHTPSCSIDPPLISGRVLCVKSTADFDKRRL